METEFLYPLDQIDHIAARLDAQPTRVLETRRFFGIPPPHNLMQPYLERAGLWDVSRLPKWPLDRAFISALVERWRPETNTFHLPYGEATITLQDVSFHLGLRVDGDPVSGCAGEWRQYYDRDIWQICQSLIGDLPPPQDILGNFVTMKWFLSIATSIDEVEHPNDLDVQRATRAWIMLLFGGYLFPDKSGNRVHLRWLPLLMDFDDIGRRSWGSAVLSTLYREMTRVIKCSVTDVGGCGAFLQSWAWLRFPQCFSGTLLHDVFPLVLRWNNVRPVTQAHDKRLLRTRSLIDSIGLHGFVWRPYEDNRIRVVTPEWVYAEWDIWYSDTSLICFATIEWHYVERVLRQFGGAQHIPYTPMNIDQLHTIDVRTERTAWWPMYHHRWHACWNARRQRCVLFHMVFDYRPSREYFDWFSVSPHRFLSLDGPPQNPALQFLMEDGVPNHAPAAPILLERPSETPDPCSTARRRTPETAQHIPVDDEEPIGGARGRRGRGRSCRSGRSSQADQGETQPAPQPEMHHQQSAGWDTVVSQDIPTTPWPSFSPNFPETSFYMTQSSTFDYHPLDYHPQDSTTFQPYPYPSYYMSHIPDQPTDYMVRPPVQFQIGFTGDADSSGIQLEQVDASLGSMEMFDRDDFSPSQLSPRSHSRFLNMLEEVRDASKGGSQYEEEKHQQKL